MKINQLISEQLRDSLALLLAGKGHKMLVEPLDDLHPNIFRLKLSDRMYVLHLYPPGFSNWNMDSVESSINAKRVLGIVADMGKLDFLYPRVVADDFASETKWICYSWIEGKPLTRESNFPFSSFHRLGLGLSKIYFESKGDWFEKNTPFSQKSNSGYWEWETEYVTNDLKRDPRKWVTPEIRQQIFKALESWKSRINSISEFALCHNDLVLGNIISDGKSVGLIDWGRAGKGSPLRDYAYLLHLPYLLNTKKKEDYLDFIIKESSRWERADSTLPFFIGLRLIISGIFSNSKDLQLANEVLRHKNLFSVLEYLDKNY